MTAVLDRRLILIAGKGGVGRSTIAAAVASACARRGRRTLLFQANAKDRVGAYFGVGSLGPDIVSLAPRLWGLNTNPTAALEEYGLMILKFRRVYRMVFENRVTRAFLRAIPGLDDYAVLGKAWYHTTELENHRPRFDTVVFDLPASGHSMSMLRIPWVITDTVPDGPLTRDARSIKALLTDPNRTGLLLATLAEEMPANEALELARRLETELAIRPAHLVINQVYPDRFPPESPSRRVLDALCAGAVADPDLAAVVAHSQLVRSRRDLNQEYMAQLEATVPGPRTHLPMLFVGGIGKSEIDHLSQALEPELG